MPTYNIIMCLYDYALYMLMSYMLMPSMLIQYKFKKSAWWK